MLRTSHAGVCDGVGDVGEEVYGDVGEADGENASLDKGVVAVGDGGEGKAADSGPTEYGLGNDGAGLAVLSLDGALPGQQREWASAVALDRADRVLIAGNRSFDYASGSNDYDWVIARLNSDVIFRDGFDGLSP